MRLSRELIRPLPFRGDLIAAGAVALATGLLLVDARFRDAWAPGARLAVSGAGAALLLGMAWLAPVEGPAPRAYVSTLLGAAFPLAAAALLDLSRALGGGGLGSAGSATWVLAALGALYVTLAVRRTSALCALLGAACGVGALLAAWSRLFHPDAVTPYRWLLLAAIAGLGLGAVVLRDRRRRHAVALVDVAGLSALALGGLSLLDAAGLTAIVPGRAGRTPWGWELALLATGCGLLAYGAADREPGPGWLGALAVALFVVLASTSASLLWWPAILVVLGGGAVAAGLRPTTPLPPPPDADAPPAAARPLERERPR